MAGARSRSGTAKDVRQKIVAAARSLVARKGVHATTMRDIAAEAAMSSSTVYRYFSGKSELMRHLALELARSDIAVAQSLSGSLDAYAAGPDHERVRELLGIPRSGRERAKAGAEARLRTELWAEASRDPALAEPLREGAETIRRTLASLPEAAGAAPQHALLLTAAYYGSHLLRSLCDESTDGYKCESAANQAQRQES